MPSPLALYQRTCPKIVWTAPAIEQEVWRQDFGLYANDAAMLADWTLDDPEGLAELLLSTEDWVSSSGKSLAWQLHGGTPPSTPWPIPFSRPVTGLPPLTTLAFKVDGRSLGPDGGVTDWAPLTVNLSNPVVTDGAGATVIEIAPGIAVGSPTSTFLWDNLRLVQTLFAGGAATLDVGFPLAKARGWSPPSPGSDRVLYPSGASATWLDESDAMLEGLVIGIPAEDDQTSFAPATGWNGPTGWQAFLEWAWDGNPFAFWRNRADVGSALTCQLVGPREPPTPGPMGTRQLTLRLRSTTLARFGGY